MSDIAPEAVTSAARPSDDPKRLDNLVGQIVADRYKIESLLGVGGMGCVYRAQHIHIKKSVAFKTLNAQMLRSPEAVARFEREAVAAARIEHPNVVVATDFGRLPDGQYFLVLELVEGRNLREEMTTRGGLPTIEALKIAMQIVSALGAAHRLGIVHRDLKPENVMLVDRESEEPLVKVLDFGVAKITLEDQSQTLTQFGAIFGTPQYMSPEQATGREVDGRSDLYSFGILLYEMLAGKLPFNATDALGFIVQQLNETPAPLPEHVPDPLRRLVSALLAKEKNDRPKSAAHVHKELERLVVELGGDSSGAGRSGVVLEQLRAGGTWLRHQLLRKWRIGGVGVPAVAVLAIVTSLIVVARWSCGRSESVPAALVEVMAANDEGSELASSVLPDLSRPEFAREVERIELLKVYQRTERDWMLLARGSAVLSRFESSALAYQALLSLRGSLRKDPRLLQDLLVDARDPKAFRIVLNLAESVLGRHGVDLLWRIWSEQRQDPERKEQAEKLAKKLVILSYSASPALRVAIELTFTNQCEKLSAVLGRAATEADSRSSTRLAELANEKGCGASGSDDCYACLRDNALLAKATQRANANKAPTLGQTPED